MTFGFQTIGTHRYRIEGDILHLAYRGLVTPEDARRVMEVVGALRRQYGYSLVLSDSREPSSTPHETRKAFIEVTTKEARMDYLGIYGMSRSNRVLATMIARGIKLIGIADVEMEFFETEAEARAFLEEKRKIVVAALSTSTRGVK